MHVARRGSFRMIALQRVGSAQSYAHKDVTQNHIHTRTQYIQQNVAIILLFLVHSHNIHAKTPCVLFINTV